MSSTYFTITNAYGSFPITYSQYNRIAKGKYRLGEYLTDRLFFKARDKKDPYAYVVKLVKEKWYLNTVEMDYNKSAMEAWIDEVIYDKKSELPQVVIKEQKVPTALGDILGDLI